MSLLDNTFEKEKMRVRERKKERERERARQKEREDDFNVSKKSYERGEREIHLSCSQCLINERREREKELPTKTDAFKEYGRGGIK